MGFPLHAGAVRGKTDYLILALQKREFRSKLQADHQSDPAFELKKGCRNLSGERLSENQYMPLAKLGCESILIV
jgi:hypothetical protein